MKIELEPCACASFLCDVVRCFSSVRFAQTTHICAIPISFKSSVYKTFQISLRTTLLDISNCLLIFRVYSQSLRYRSDTLSSSSHAQRCSLMSVANNRRVALPCTEYSTSSVIARGATCYAKYIANVFDIWLLVM